MDCDIPQSFTEKESKDETRKYKHIDIPPWDIPQTHCCQFVCLNTEIMFVKCIYINWPQATYRCAGPATWQPDTSRCRNMCSDNPLKLRRISFFFRWIMDRVTYLASGGDINNIVLLVIWWNICIGIGIYVNSCNQRFQQQSNILWNAILILCQC